jgi:vacuolar-type H+-ATPase subunit E/Vma4
MDYCEPEIVDAVFKKVIEILKTESTNEYIKHMTNFIKALDLKGKYEVIPGANESRVDDIFVKKLEKETGLNLSLSEDKLPGYSGFTLKREKIEINLAPEVIIPAIKNELEDSIKDLLFEE